MSAVIVLACATMPAALAVPAPAPSMATLAATFSFGVTNNCNRQRGRSDNQQP